MPLDTRDSPAVFSEKSTAESVFAGLYPVHALALDAARLHLKCRAQLTRALEMGRAPACVRRAENRETLAAAALAEALRQIDSPYEP